MCIRKYKMKFSVLLIFSFFILQSALSSQNLYDGPDDPAGDKAAERIGVMTGNRVLIQFRNTSELSDCCGLGYDVSKWPNNFDGTKMNDGIATLIGARVFLEHDTIPVTTGYQGRTDLDTLYYVQSSYREHMDKDPTLTIEWGLYPVFGYFNPLSETPAMSNRPESWPLAGWPSTGNQTKWQGLWNGRFGSLAKADLECYFVANDAQDQEYLQPGRRVRYYPRPGYQIGYKDPNVTIQKGAPWGGIGVRLEMRGYQWSNPSATDAIFWEYNIANISDYNLPEMIFGFWMDNAVGGEEGVGDDLSYYSTDLDMAYTWDIDFIPVGGGKAPGIMGFAYLESPGIGNDFIDNDEDGLTDEKRDNIAVNKVGPTAGITDMNKFLAAYHLNPEDLKEHWDADEDQDWQDGNDLNGNGIYDDGEDPGDDLGLDGIGIYDIDYTGPDEGECNHKPDYLPGVGCEANFAITDVSESDMLGLTSFHYTVGLLRESIIRTDESIYLYMEDNTFGAFQSVPLNFMEFFASGKFPLAKGKTERFSMAELHSYDPLAGLMSDNHAAPSLFRLKEVAQVIYETDYRFAQPPLMPKLNATPADGKVILTWDDVADTRTRDPFLKNVNDFEGYKIYRATDKKMSDAELITDGYGNPRLKKPIFQCDIVDNRVGFADFGAIDGIQFYLGEDSGIKHYFVDENVQNGRTYYYVLVAYDYGISDIGGGISPSENTYILDLNESEEIREVSKNVAIVTPHQFAAGYKSPFIEMPSQTTYGSSFIAPAITIFDQVKPDHTYKVKFDVDTIYYLRQDKRLRHPHDMLYVNNGFSIYDVSENNTLIYQETIERFSGTNIKSGEYIIPGSPTVEYKYLADDIVTSGVIDGVQITMPSLVRLGEVDFSRSGWITGTGQANIKVNPIESMYFPWQYNIIFTDNPEEHTGLTNNARQINDENGNPLGPAQLLFNQKVNFHVENTLLKKNDGTFERLDMVVYDINQNKIFEPDSDKVLVGYSAVSGTRIYWAGTLFSIDFAGVINKPKAGDVYRLDFKRPFLPQDSILFTVKPEVTLDADKLKGDMNKIKVVPNPYVMTNAMEPSVTNYQFNPRRRLMFTNLPASCVIKIFTVSGVMIDEIDVENSVVSRAADWDLNSESNGIAYWDLKTKENLDVAAGYYIYHVRSKITGEEKMGKFAVIK